VRGEQLFDRANFLIFGSGSSGIVAEVDRF
jgi:hypothetical protein